MGSDKWFHDHHRFTIGLDNLSVFTRCYSCVFQKLYSIAEVSDLLIGVLPRLVWVVPRKCGQDSIKES